MLRTGDSQESGVAEPDQERTQAVRGDEPTGAVQRPDDDGDGAQNTQVIRTESPSQPPSQPPSDEGPTQVWGQPR